MKKILFLLCVFIIPGLAFGQALFTSTDGVASPDHEAQISCHDGTNAQKVLCDSSGNLSVGIPASATSIAKAEDATHTSGDVGVAAWGVRNDTLATLAGADGDYAPFQFNSDGALYSECTLSGNVDVTSAAVSGDAIEDGGSSVEVKYAAINVDGADSDSIIAAVADKKFKVLGYAVVCDDIVNITFEDSDGTDFTGAMPLAANGGVSYSASPYGAFETTTANKALHLLKSAAVNCDGHITYAEID